MRLPRWRDALGRGLRRLAETVESGQAVDGTAAPDRDAGVGMVAGPADTGAGPPLTDEDAAPPAWAARVAAAAAAGTAVRRVGTGSASGERPAALRSTPSRAGAAGPRHAVPSVVEPPARAPRSADDRRRGRTTLLRDAAAPVAVPGPGRSRTPRLVLAADPSRLQRPAADGPAPHRSDAIPAGAHAGRGAPVPSSDPAPRPDREADALTRVSNAVVQPSRRAAPGPRPAVAALPRPAANSAAKPAAKPAARPVGEAVAQPVGEPWAGEPPAVRRAAVVPTVGPRIDESPVRRPTVSAAAPRQWQQPVGTSPVPSSIWPDLPVRSLAGHATPVPVEHALARAVRLAAEQAAR